MEQNKKNVKRDFRIAGYRISFLCPLKLANSISYLAKISGRRTFTNEVIYRLHQVAMEQLGLSEPLCDEKLLDWVQSLSVPPEESPDPRKRATGKKSKYTTRMRELLMDHFKTHGLWHDGQ